MDKLVRQLRQSHLSELLIKELLTRRGGLYEQLSVAEGNTLHWLQGRCQELSDLITLFSRAEDE